jgi:hypothetical protein
MCAVAENQGGCETARESQDQVEAMH